MNSLKRNRIIGVGNLLMGDDGLGIVAIEELRKLKLSPEIDLIDGGCGGLTLLQLLAECDRALLIDAADFGRISGSILRLGNDEITVMQKTSGQVSLHQTGLAEVLTLAEKLDQLPELILYLVQPQSLERGMGLSIPLQEAMPRLLNMVSREVSGWK